MTRRLKNAVTVLLFLTMLAAFVAESFVPGRRLNDEFFNAGCLILAALVAWVVFA